MNMQATQQNMQQAEYKIWLNQLLQQKELLNQLQINLGWLSLNAGKKELLPRVEQFQNRFIRQHEVIDLLRHDIKQYENHLEDLQNDDDYLMDEFSQLKAVYTRYFDLFLELQRDFDEFFA